MFAKVSSARSVSFTVRSRSSSSRGSSKRLGEDLQRHPATEQVVLGLVDDRHAAAADLAEDAVVADFLESTRRGDVVCRGR